jgi:hypothetical protein
MSVERVERKDGSVVWRVRWRQGGRNRSKVLGRKRDAEAFDAKLVRRKRTGELAQLDAGKESLADFGGSGSVACDPARRANRLPWSCRGAVKSQELSSLRRCLTDQSQEMLDAAGRERLLPSRGLPSVTATSAVWSATGGVLAAARPWARWRFLDLLHWTGARLAPTARPAPRMARCSGAVRGPLLAARPGRAHVPEALGRMVRQRPTRTIPRLVPSKSPPTIVTVIV